MKLTILSLFIMSLCGPLALAKNRIELRPTSDMAQAGTVDYSFDLIDTNTGKLISDAELAIDMEKNLHMIVYDPSLKEFQHVHPAFDGKTWKVQMNFTVNGNYWVWAQGKLKKGSVEFSSPSRLMVMGGGAEWPTTPVLGDVRKGSADITHVELGADALVAGSMAMLDVKFSRNNGTAPELTPYLGAFAHVVVVPSTGDALQHVHVMDVSSDEGMLHTTFPAAGEYRLWIQFVDGGKLKVIPLSVVVTK